MSVSEFSILTPDTWKQKLGVNTNSYEERQVDMDFHGTTILAVRHQGKAAVAGDGQVTLDKNVVKHHARKVRRIYNDKIIVGFAGATADALNLSERLEQKLERYNGNLTRSAVELARDWRTDKYLRRLEAIMVAVDDELMYLISGNGDVIERTRASSPSAPAALPPSPPPQP